jgi:hypothetical protein
MDLSQFDTEVLLARGKYSTVRAEHERLKIELQKLCSSIQGDLNAVLKAATGNTPVDCSEGIESIRETLNSILSIASQCGVLVQQKEELKLIAYP